MTQALTKVKGVKATLAEFCRQFDATHGAEPGTGLRAARMLMSERVLVVNLGSPMLAELPVMNFTLTGSRGKLRAMGAA